MIVFYICCMIALLALLINAAQLCKIVTQLREINDRQWAVHRLSMSKCDEINRQRHQEYLGLYGCALASAEHQRATLEGVNSLSVSLCALGEQLQHPPDEKGADLRPDCPDTDKSEDNAAALAEKAFTEGVLNVLGYSADIARKGGEAK